MNQRIIAYETVTACHFVEGIKYLWMTMGNLPLALRKVRVCYAHMEHFMLGSKAHRELLQQILIDGTANILFERVGRASAQKHIGQDWFLCSIITAAISKLFSPVSDATLLKRFRAETRPGRHYYAAERKGGWQSKVSRNTFCLPMRTQPISPGSSLFTKQLPSILREAVVSSGC